jgi:hypothetical protein
MTFFQVMPFLQMEIVLIRVVRCNHILYWLILRFIAIWPNFHPATFRLAKGFRLFASGLPWDLPQNFFSYRLIGALFWSYDIILDFSPCPVFNARNFFIPAAFDIM